MAKSRKHPPKQPISDAPSLASAQKALSLLDAAAFDLRWDGSQYHISWSNADTITRILGGASGRIPTCQEELDTFLPENARASRHAAIASLKTDGTTYSLTYQMNSFDNGPRWIEEIGQRLSGIDRRPTHIQSVLRDVTEVRQNEIQAAHRATHDPLTGLWNQVRFSEAVNANLQSASLRHVPGCLIGLSLIGIDDIRRDHGDAAVDYVLQILAARLRSEIRPPNDTARIGATLFGLLVPGDTVAEAQARAKLIEGWLTDAPLSTPYGTLELKGQTRVIPLSTDAQHVDLIALLTTESEPSPKTRAARGDTPEYTKDDILSALNERRLELVYQPIVHAKTRQLHHYECLMRLRTGDTLQSAWGLILAAEELDLVHLIDQRALEMAAQTLKNQPDIELAVNISAGTIAHPDVTEAYLKTLSALSQATSRLTLELTETVELANIERAAAFAKQAKALGCRFAIDDFGAGHTTFQNLLAIKADMIKIDGTLVTNLAASPHKQAFIRMMVDLARTFNVNTVAEMVSDEADAAHMAVLGIDYFQGYMFGMPKPLPPQDERLTA